MTDAIYNGMGVGWKKSWYGASLLMMYDAEERQCELLIFLWK